MDSAIRPTAVDGIQNRGCIYFSNIIEAELRFRRRGAAFEPGPAFQSKWRLISLIITHYPLPIAWQEERCGKTSLRDNAQCGIGNVQCPRDLNVMKNELRRKLANT